MSSKMLYFRRFRGEITNEQASLFSEFKKRLTGKLEPLLEPAVLAIARILDASPEELKQTGTSQPALYEMGRAALDGELLTDGKSLFVVVLGDMRRRMLRQLEPPRLKADAGVTIEISLIGPQWNSESLHFLLEQVRLLFGVDLQSFSYGSDRFNELKAEAREGATEPSFTLNEVRAAEILADRTSRSIAIAMKSSGGLLIRDVSKQVPNENRETVEAAMLALRNGQIIDSEVVVVCRKTQSQVSRAPNREVLVELSAKGVKCACGPALAEEQMEEALTATELGRLSLDKSRWLTILLIKELERVGVSNDAILIEQSIGGDEIDCVANIGGELTLFELKDKEFNLGNAYLVWREDRNCSA